MKNLKEQYERYFGKLTERAKTSDSDVKTFISLMKGYPEVPLLTPKQVVDFVNKYDLDAEDLTKVAESWTLQYGNG